MTTYERFKRIYEHKEADRVPIVDSPWNGTVRRWRKEGMPADVDWRDYFDVDKVAGIGVDITPRFETKILEETTNDAPGTVLGLTKTGLKMACGDGVIEIRVLQAEGGKRMAAPDYFRGHPLN